MKKTTVNYKGLAIFVIIFAALLIAAFIEKQPAAEYIEYREFLEMLESRKIESLTLTDGPVLRFSLIGGTELFETDNPRKPELKEELLKAGVSVSEGSYISAGSVIQSALGIVFFMSAAFFGVKMLNKSYGKNAMSLQVSDCSSSNPVPVRFSDIAGNEEAKEGVRDIIDFIKNPEKFAKYGARMPHGMIFYGAPGTGKTLMAKAIAGEAGVSFFAVSGSDFVQMYVGVGAGRIRELFSVARKKGKAVIFIDEIDALGKTRAPFPSGGNDERDQTLNALLTEMSGFNSSEGIIVIAATNRLDTLDEALLRPGRFDRHVEISLPDLNSRKKILAHYAAGKPLSDDFDIAELAGQCAYFSGAMLENLMNEAAIAAAKDGSGQICRKHADTAFYTIVAGSEKIDRSQIRQDERKIAAYHEAGHALAARLCSPESIVSKISIIPSTKGAGGFCVSVPPDRMYYTKNELMSQVMISYAGRAAEELIFGADNITTGASNDIEKAGKIISDFVEKYGMSDGLGMISPKHFDDKNAVSNECKKLTAQLYGKAKDMLEKNIEKLHNISAALLEKETLCGNELEKILRNEM